MTSALLEPAARCVHDRGIDWRDRLSAGDVEWIASCYHSYGAVVRNYLSRYVAHQDVDDVTQRVFFEMWRSVERYDPDRSLRAWLLGIAHKRAIDHIRHSRVVATGQVPFDAIDELTGEDGRVTSERIASAVAVADALALLPARHSSIIRLTYFDGYTQTEIGRLLGIPLGTVKSCSARGLKSLARILAEPSLGFVR